VNSTPPSRPTKRDTIRIVDDDLAVLASLRFSLEIDGFDVETFSSAEDFLAASPNADACLIIDQQLTSTTGLDLIAEIRRRGFFPPMVLITSHASTALRRGAAAAGVPIVEKPFLGSVLVDTIRSVAASANVKSADQ
jgi:FixJ family two-component response regulator